MGIVKKYCSIESEWLQVFCIIVNLVTQMKHTHKHTNICSNFSFSLKLRSKQAAVARLMEDR